MRSIARDCQRLRVVQAHSRAVGWACLLFTLTNCSSEGEKKGTDQGLGGSAAGTNGTAVGGAQTTHDAGGAWGSGGSEAGAGGSEAGAGGQATPDAGSAGELIPEFVNPPVGARLKVRSSGVGSTLQELARTGFGAVEMGVDFLDTNGAATLSTTLQTAKQYGIRVDLAPGGSMPYVSPGISEADSMQQLTAVPSKQLVSDGTLVFADAAPRPTDAQLAPSPTRALVAVTAARVTGVSGTTTLLDPGSAADLTSSVDGSGNLNWTVPEGTWIVFGFWQRATGQVPMGFPPFESPTVWSSRVPTQGAGRYFTADIFSGAGIGKALDYLKTNFLTPDNLDLLRGSQFAHDSLEVQAEMFWTSDLPAQFSANRGYSMIQYLPALHTPKESWFDPLTPGWGVTPPLTPEYDFIDDVGNRIRYDYHRTLTDLYVGRYLKTFTDQLHELGMSSRVEVAYNYMPLNMTRSGAAVDIPENESFDSGWGMPFDTTVPAYGTDRWRHMMDSYRLTGSGAHLNKGKRATIEFGDDFAMYRKQPVDYVQQLHEGYAGGITMGLLTAFVGVDDSFPVAGGMAAIGLGDFWTTGWPQWRDWSQLTDYFARSTVLLEMGKPQVDVVIYLDEGSSGVHELTTPKFASSALESAGFTYDFVDPVSLVSPKATAVRGRLFGEGPSYQALVIRNQSSIPAEAAQTILGAARDGLRVVIVGEPPNKSPGLHDAERQDAMVVQSMSELIALSNVARVQSADDAAGALLKLGSKPSASFGAAGRLLTVHRITDQNEDIYWVFNPTDGDVSVVASFAAAGVPYQLDLWNGTSGRVAQWAESEGSVSMPVRLAAHATTALLFRHETAPFHITATSAEEALWDNGELLVRDTRGDKQTVACSDGRTLTVELGTVPSPIEVGPWHLEVDETSPNGHAMHNIDLPALSDWRDIAELRDAVGRANYSATIDVSESWLSSERDVMLDVGAVAGAMQLSVNGTLVTRQTTPGGKWSIRKLLKAGPNEIAVRLDTSILNRMAQLSADAGPPISPAPSGLLGPVRLIPAAVKRVGP